MLRKSHLREIQARVESATPGPMTISATAGTDRLFSLVNPHGNVAAMQIVGQQNAEFLGHAWADVHALLACVSWLQAHLPRWIAVEDEPPEVGEGEHRSECVLVWDNGQVERAHYYVAGGTSGWWLDNEDYSIEAIPTHWMPLPQPPEHLPPLPECS